MAELSVVKTFPKRFYSLNFAGPSGEGPWSRSWSRCQFTLRLSLTSTTNSARAVTAGGARK